MKTISNVVHLFRINATLPSTENKKASRIKVYLLVGAQLKGQSWCVAVDGVVVTLDNGSGCGGSIDGSNCGNVGRGGDNDEVLVVSWWW